jgi:membrane protein implicated in regulation of membrane protease activity
MGAGSIFTWWNAIYSLPLAFVLLFLAITSLVSLAGDLFGGLAHSEGETGVASEAHAEAEHDLDVDTDLDADTDLDVGHDLDAEHDLHGDAHAHHDHGEHGHGHDAFLTALGFLGVGRAPLVMVLQVLLLSWGLIGVALHRAAGAAGPGALFWSLPLTLVLSVLATRTTALLFGRLFKPMETSIVRSDQLVGYTGRVVFPVTEEEGTIHIRDQHGTLHRVRARSQHGRLESGQEIIVLGYDAAQRVYQVDDASTFVDRS